MKIKISHQDEYALAGLFARDILWAVHDQHARLLGKERWGYIPERIQEIRATVRSIEDPFDRMRFVFHIGYQFKALRTEKGTAIRGRDYVAAVRALEAKERERRAA